MDISPDNAEVDKRQTILATLVKLEKATLGIRQYVSFSTFLGEATKLMGLFR